MWLSWITRDPGTPHGIITPRAIVLHRMIGTFDGSASLGRAGYFHFGVAQDGRAAQYGDTTWLQWHCGRQNPVTIGIEFEGQNSDVELLTPEAIATGRRIIADVAPAHSIPLAYFGPPDAGRLDLIASSWSGLINHANLYQTGQPGDEQHYNYVTPEQAAQLMHADPPPEVPEMLFPTCDFVTADGTTFTFGVGAQGTDRGQLWHRERPQGGAWTPWANHGGVCTSAPRVVVYGDRATVFVCGAEALPFGIGGEWYIERDPITKQWGSWVGLGGVFAPSVMP